MFFLHIFFKKLKRNYRIYYIYVTITIFKEEILRFPYVSMMYILEIFFDVIFKL